MRIRSRLLTRLAARILVAVLRLLFWTCRKVVRLEAPGINPYADTGEQRYLYCVWHDQLIMPLFCGRSRNAAALVSRHQDGSYVADVLELVGMAAVRGSTRRGGARALRELVEKSRNLHIVITPDGPRGPRHEVKSGLIFLASHSGRKIVPTAFACNRCWRIPGTWTDMVIPKPFTEVVALAGRPLAVPPSLKRDGIDHYALRLQAEMERLEQEVQPFVTGDVRKSEDRKAAA